MQTDYENALSFIESYGWNDEKLRKADSIIPLVATMMELYSKGKELKPTDIKEENKQEIEKYCDLILSMSMDFKCGRIEHSHYINTLFSTAKQLKKINT